MQTILLDSETVLGAISLEKNGEFTTPWRIFHKEKDFYMPNLLEGVAEIPAGVRITFKTNSTKLTVEFAAPEYELVFDLVIDKKFVTTVIVDVGDTSFTVENLSTKNKLIEVYLSQQQKVSLRNVYITEDADWNVNSSLQKNG